MGAAGQWILQSHRLAGATCQHFQSVGNHFYWFFDQKNQFGFIGFIALVFLLPIKPLSIGKKPSLEVTQVGSKVRGRANLGAALGSSVGLYGAPLAAPGELGS